MIIVQNENVTNHCTGEGGSGGGFFPLLFIDSSPISKKSIHLMLQVSASWITEASPWLTSVTISVLDMIISETDFVMPDNDGE